MLVRWLTPRAVGAAGILSLLSLSAIAAPPISASTEPASGAGIATPSAVTSVTPPATVSVPAGEDADIFGKVPCSGPKSVGHFDSPLTHTTALLSEGRPLTIVAIGSSSTAGAGASSPAFHYPNRLADELRKKFPRSRITMINRGVNGDDVANMMSRLETGVLKERPDLVLWQFGTNALLRDEDMASNITLVSQGIKRIRALGADVILVDPQYTPRVIAKKALNDLLALMDTVAHRERVALFPRFAVMRHWHEDRALAFDNFSNADGLHLNDWGYACFAHVMGGMIADTVTRSRNIVDRPLSATLHPM